MKLEATESLSQTKLELELATVMVLSTRIGDLPDRIM